MEKKHQTPQPGPQTEDKKNLSKVPSEQPEKVPGQDDRKNYPNEIYEEILPPDPRLN